MSDIVKDDVMNRSCVHFWTVAAKNENFVKIHLNISVYCIYKAIRLIKELHKMT